MEEEQKKVPKVFISHASEDKERFVLDFARRLRERGIDAWLDRWEMLPGDSLVDKIFEEGIGQAAALIVILSKNSVQKNWVNVHEIGTCLKMLTSFILEMWKWERSEFS